MIRYYLFFFGSVIIASCCQLLLKKSAMKSYSSKLKEYLNPLVFSAYFFLFISSILTLLAYQKIPLKEGPVIQSVGYILVLGLSSIFFHEKITRNKVIGIVLIIVGIIVFSF